MKIKTENVVLFPKLNKFKKLLPFSNVLKLTL